MYQNYHEINTGSCYIKLNKIILLKSYMKNQRELTFYFDYISPYSYLAWRKIGHFCERHKLKLVAEPVVFGALLSHWGTKGPAEIDAKRLFTYKDVIRSAHRDNYKIYFPPAHPFNPLLALRATCFMQEHPEYHRFITHVFTACWQEGNDITNPEIIDKIFRIYKVENGVERCTTEDMKNILKEKTSRAIERGVFGVPSMLIDDELFWGNDRFDFLEDYINGDDPVDPSDLERLKTLPRGIDRKEVRS